MTNKTISITCDSDNHAALTAFSNALREMAGASANPVIGELRYKVSVDTTEAAEKLKQVVEDTTSQQVASLVQPQNIAEYYPVEEYLHMRRDSDDSYRLAKSDAERDECIALGYVQHTWEPRSQGNDEDDAPVGEPRNVDGDGLPWDSRIHSGNKALNADGTWRVRRKPKDLTDDQWATELENVRGELKQLMSIPVPPADDVVLPNDADAALIIAAPEPDAVTVFTAPVTPPAPPAPPAPPITDAPITAPAPPVSAPEVPADMTFPKLMMFLTERVRKITLEEVNDLVLKQGLVNVQQFNQRPDLIGAFVADVNKMLKDKEE